MLARPAVISIRPSKSSPGYRQRPNRPKASFWRRNWLKAVFRDRLVIQPRHSNCLLESGGTPMADNRRVPRSQLLGRVFSSIVSQGTDVPRYLTSLSAWFISNCRWFKMRPKARSALCCWKSTWKSSIRSCPFW